MSTYTPFQAGMTISGTWSYVGTTTPSPAVPVTYDAAIDFEGFAAGIYIYRYTVTSGGETHTADVSITWQGDGIAPSNDVCAGSRFIEGLTDCPGIGTIAFSTAKQCSLDVAAPTDSGVEEPAAWTLPSYGGDLWYRIVPPSCTVGYPLQVSISGNGNTADAKGIGVAVYSGSCQTLVLEESGSSNSNETSISITVQVDANFNGLYYVRIASATAGSGNIGVQCVSDCTHSGGVPITLYYTSFPNDESATIGGVANCGIYRLSQVNDYAAISPGGKGLYVSRVGSCVSYASDAAAEAGGIGLGSVYAISEVNDYGLASAGGRLAVVRTDGSSVSTFKGPFANDTAAAVGGVVIGEPYLAAPVNDYTFPSGGGRTLLVRTT